MLSALPRFADVRVLVVGDLMLDRYWHGATARISPEAPVPVVQVRKDEVRAGGAGNVALNAAALGCQAVLAGLVGDDDTGRTLLAGLRERGVDCQVKTVADAPTITKLRVISRQQQLIRLDFEERFEAHHARGLASAATFDAVQALILSDYGKGTLADLASLISAARARKLPIVVDPKGLDFSRYRGATVLKPNRSEFEAVVGPCADEAELVARGARLCAELDLTALLITRSEQGVSLIERDRPAWHLPAHAREVFDVTGAGDTVSAVLGCALGAGLGLRDATALANLAAGIVVGKLGTATASIAELRAELERHAPLPCGRLSAAAAAQAIERSRQAGESTVLALGPFAPFDAARLDFIAAAAAAGDRLLLLSTGDDAATPILDALRMVDWVLTAADAAAMSRLAAELGADVLALQPGASAELAALPGARFIHG